MIRHIWILIAKKLNGEATEEEIRQLERFKEYPPDDESPIDVMEQIWNSVSVDGNGANKEELDRRWVEIQSRIKNREVEEKLPQSASISHRSWASIIKFAGCAAAFILAICFAYYLNVTTNAGREVIAMTAPVNGTSKVTLPDGSTVWLNAGSKITYRTNNENHCREVALSGEAYFDVIKDARHPFTVTTSTFKITVLGTAFNVRSYESGKTAEATLVRGRIELTLLKNPDTKYILKPAEKFTMTKVSEHAKVKDGNNDFSSVEVEKIHEYSIEGLPSEVLWTKDVIDFDNAGFEDIAKMMEHKYNVTIIFKDENIKKIKFSGKFKNETIEEAMKEMREVIDFKYSINKDQVMIF